MFFLGRLIIIDTNLSAHALPLVPAYAPLMPSSGDLIDQHLTNPAKRVRK